MTRTIEMINEIRKHDYDLCNGNHVRNVILDLIEAEALLDLKQAQTNAQQPHGEICAHYTNKSCNLYGHGVPVKTSPC